MEQYNNNNMTNGNNINKNFSQHKSRKNATFSQAALNKSDVGDFQAGYFVMAETVKENQLPTQQYQQRPTKQHRTPERHHNQHQYQQQRARSPKDQDVTHHITILQPSHSQPLLVVRDGDHNVSHGRLMTSPTRSPQKNRRTSHSQLPHIDSTNVPLSPHKPRKAHHEKHVDTFSLESGSPPKYSSSSPSSSSPPPNRWAGPAFGNAPPPSSLPLPDFPPFTPSSQSSSPASLSPSISPSSSPPPQPTYIPAAYQEPYFQSHPSYSAPYPVPPHFSNLQFTYVDQAPSLAQLSTDLRRMLNISNPIPA